MFDRKINCKLVYYNGILTIRLWRVHFINLKFRSRHLKQNQLTYCWARAFCGWIQFYCFSVNQLVFFIILIQQLLISYWMRGVQFVKCNLLSAYTDFVPKFQLNCNFQWKFSIALTENVFYLRAMIFFFIFKGKIEKNVYFFISLLKKCLVVILTIAVT